MGHHSPKYISESWGPYKYIALNIQKKIKLSKVIGLCTEMIRTACRQPRAQQHTSRTILTWVVLFDPFYAIFSNLLGLFRQDLVFQVVPIEAHSEPAEIQYKASVFGHKKEVVAGSDSRLNAYCKSSKRDFLTLNASL